MNNRVEGGLFVIRRPFKASGTLFNVGEVVDPTDLKLFRSRLSDRDIIELLPGEDEKNISWLEYLESRATEKIDSQVYALVGKPDPNAKKPVAAKVVTSKVK